MISANRPIINLDLDLLRTFVAVADLNTFAAAAAAVCRTQSAVSQQMQRLEQLVGKELFARHGRNKLLTEHGIQLLGYARKILRFNDEACSSLMFSNLQGVLTIGASDESADTILPFLLNRVSSVYPKLALDVRVKRNAYMAEMLESQEVDLMVTTHRPSTFLIVAIGLCCLMLVGGWFLGGRARARSKNVPFESGIDSVGSARLRLSAKFYLVAMFFVIFDVEALYLFAWSTSIRESGWVGFVEAAIFIFVLLAGLVYLVRIGALDWTPARSRRERMNPETNSIANRQR